MPTTLRLSVFSTSLLMALSTLGAPAQTSQPTAAQAREEAVIEAILKNQCHMGFHEPLLKFFVKSSGARREKVREYGLGFFDPKSLRLKANEQAKAERFLVLSAQAPKCSTSLDENVRSEVKSLQARLLSNFARAGTLQNFLVNGDLVAVSNYIVGSTLDLALNQLSQIQRVELLSQLINREVAYNWANSDMRSIAEIAKRNLDFQVLGTDPSLKSRASLWQALFTIEQMISDFGSRTDRSVYESAAKVRAMAASDDDVDDIYRKLYMQISGRRLLLPDAFKRFPKEVEILNRLTPHLVVKLMDMAFSDRSYDLGSLDLGGLDSAARNAFNQSMRSYGSGSGFGGGSGGGSTQKIFSQWEREEINRLLSSRDYSGALGRLESFGGRIRNTVLSRRAEAIRGIESDVSMLLNFCQKAEREKAAAFFEGCQKTLVGILSEMLKVSEKDRDISYLLERLLKETLPGSGIVYILSEETIKTRNPGRLQWMNANAQKTFVSFREFLNAAPQSYTFRQLMTPVQLARLERDAKTQLALRAERATNSPPRVIPYGAPELLAQLDQTAWTRSEDSVFFILPNEMTVSRREFSPLFIERENSVRFVVVSDNDKSLVSGDRHTRTAVVTARSLREKLELRTGLSDRLWEDYLDLDRSFVLHAPFEAFEAAGNTWVQKVRSDDLQNVAVDLGASVTGDNLVLKYGNMKTETQVGKAIEHRVYLDLMLKLMDQPSIDRQLERTNLKSVESQALLVVPVHQKQSTQFNSQACLNSAFPVLGTGCGVITRDVRLGENSSMITLYGPREQLIGTRPMHNYRLFVMPRVLESK